VLELVGRHHERLDGGGYPRGLIGAELATGPRILAACDVYDALVSDRVYRDAWTPRRALGLLVAESGTAFDGTCVAALAGVIGERPLGLVPAPAPAVPDAAPATRSTSPA
jgi:HD-GYP domain-containing protein (c-di-GMP phosphodiesterase class II)